MNDMIDAGPHLLWLLGLAVSLCAPGCTEPAPVAKPSVIQVRLGQHTFTLEVAADEKARNFGLMFRQSMPADHGMLFVFDDERPLGFWMKNTYIPLDILFLDAQGKVISIQQMRPLDESTTPSGGPARYAIELNQGASQQAGVKVGDVVHIPAGAR